MCHTLECPTFSPVDLPSRPANHCTVRRAIGIHSLLTFSSPAATAVAFFAPRNRDTFVISDIHLCPGEITELVGVSLKLYPPDSTSIVKLLLISFALVSSTLFFSISFLISLATCSCRSVPTAGSNRLLLVVMFNMSELRDMRSDEFRSLHRLLNTTPDTMILCLNLCMTRPS